MTLATDCADTSVVRTTSRQELLFIRSQIVITAKAFGLEAIDMVRTGLTLHFGVSPVFQVCVNYRDPEYLRDECEDGRRLGFTGKVWFNSSFPMIRRPHVRLTASNSSKPGGDC